MDILTEIKRLYQYLPVGLFLLKINVRNRIGTYLLVLYSTLWCLVLTTSLSYVRAF